LTATDARTAADIDVVVPSYQRPGALARCLEALTCQTIAPARLIVVARADDPATQAVAHAAHGAHNAQVTLITVTEPGVIAALSAGVAESTASILAFTDDDAMPRPDWIERLLGGFADPAVGAVGGRDVIPGEEGPLTEHVGRFARSGKLVGNHHVGSGGPRDVHVLKGVNMAFRAEALALPVAGVLRGTGAQVDFEVLVCSWARRWRWRLVYDPAILVDHYPAGRVGPDHRYRPATAAVFHAAYNSVAAPTLVKRRELLRQAPFGIAIGSRGAPGVLRALAAVVRREPEVLRRVFPSLAGKVAATVGVLVSSNGRPAVVSTAALRSPVDNRPRVALVAHGIHDRGGMEIACAELIRHLHDRLRFTVVSAELAPDLRPLIDRWIRIRVPLRPFPLNFGTFFVRAGLAVRRLDVDLVYTVGAIIPNRVDIAAIHYCNLGARDLQRNTGLTTTSTLRRMNSALARAMAIAAERLSYRPTRLSRFAAVSAGVAEEVRRHFPGVQIDLVQNGVDHDRFHPDATVRRQMRAELGTGSSIVALFVGGDWPRKGVEIAIGAVAAARAHGNDVVLWVVGPGDTRRATAAARALGIEDHVTFHGRRADTERFYAAADVFILPTAYETFSLVALEAAAMGLPVIVTRVHTWFGDDADGAGAIVVERDVPGFAAALTTLAADPRLRSELGERARRAADAFTWARSAAANGRIYDELMADPSRKRPVR